MNLFITVAFYTEVSNSRCVKLHLLIKVISLQKLYATITY